MDRYFAKLLKLVTLLLVLFPAVLKGQTAPKEKVDVYLLGGQSNMEGKAQVSNLTEDWLRPMQETYFWVDSTFKLLTPGKTQTSRWKPQFGPEISFARYVKRRDRPVYLIKYAKAGMPLDYGWDIRTSFDTTQWHPGPPMPGRINFYPGQSTSDSSRGILYKEMISRFRNGLQALRDQNYTPVIRGFVWMQGEQDSKVKVAAKRYADDLKLLHRRLARDLHVNGLPMVYGQVLPSEHGLPIYTYREIIRQQMAKADMASGQPEAIFRAKMIPTDDFPLRSDQTHYNAQGQILLGKKMARGMAVAQKMGQKIMLWPHQVPGFPKGYDHHPPKQLDPQHITEVNNPFMRFYPADSTKATGKSVIIFSGGGYRLLADKKESDRAAAYYADHGITCFTVKYRVSQQDNPEFQFPGPLLDARRAIRLVKSDAQKWNISPDKVGVMGFSAGGHLAAMCATLYNQNLAGEKQPAENLRPAFCALIYPVVSMTASYMDQGSRHALFGPKADPQLFREASPERQVQKGNPPFFILQNEWDHVSSENSFYLALACKTKDVPVEYHLYPGSQHGFGVGSPGESEAQNPAVAWLELLQKFINRL